MKLKLTKLPTKLKLKLKLSLAKMKTTKFYLLNSLFKFLQSPSDSLNLLIAVLLSADRQDHDKTILCRINKKKCCPL